MQTALSSGVCIQTGIRAARNVSLLQHRAYATLAVAPEHDVYNTALTCKQTREMLTEKAPVTAEQQPVAAQLWREARQSVQAGALILVAAAAVLGLYVWSMPPLEAHDLAALLANFPPKSLTSVITVRDTLLSYAQSCPVTVAVGLMMLYVIMQTFAIPGTVSLSLLSGALYGSTRGFLLVAIVSTLGSSSCYFMSKLFGRPVARAIWREKLDHFSTEVSRQNHDLLSYIIFLRVTPVLPNVFINVASPIVGVPFLEFFLGTLIGCAPNNFIAANAGDHLSDLDSLADLYTPKMLLLGLTVGCVALLPVYVKHRHERGVALLAQKLR